MISTGDRVRVHYNRHRGDFSVVSPTTGRVICNVPTITLRDVEFRVGQAGRTRAVREGCRNVHAYAVGIVETTEAREVAELVPVTYNPHRAAHFHVKDYPGAPVRSAHRVTFAESYCYAVGTSE